MTEPISRESFADRMVEWVTNIPAGSELRVRAVMGDGTVTDWSTEVHREPPRPDLPSMFDGTEPRHGCEENPDWDGPDAVLMECDRCGQERPCEYVMDPFVNEDIVEPEDGDGRAWWCKPCLDGRAGDV